MQPAGTRGTHVVDVPVDPARLRVHEEGWQSWSPALARRAGEPPVRWATARGRVMASRPESAPPADGFWAEGLLAVDPGDGGPVRVVAARGPAAVPSITARLVGDGPASRLRARADGPVEVTTDDGPGGLAGALGRWAERFAAAAGAAPPREAPTIWCSWYHYSTRVTEADVDENVDAVGRLGLGVDVVQVDDGWQAGIGDWLVESGRFRSLAGTVRRIRDAGLRAGIWVAPFLVGSRSTLAREHPDWLVPGAWAGRNWGQDLGVLDVTRPGAAAYLAEVFGHLRSLGVDFVKLDFTYAGAMQGPRAEPVDGVAAYRHGMALVRDAVGPDTYLLGCGAPVLPSVGLVDAMRVSPDIGLTWEPDDGEPFGPGQRSATGNGRARAWQHGRLWVNDTDCLLARPGVERREEWAEHVAQYGGLRGSSDRLADLDAWGLETTRRLVRRVPPTPFTPSGTG